MVSLFKKTTNSPLAIAAPLLQAFANPKFVEFVIIYKS